MSFGRRGSAAQSAHSNVVPLDGGPAESPADGANRPAAANRGAPAEPDRADQVATLRDAVAAKWTPAEIRDMPQGELAQQMAAIAVDCLGDAFMDLNLLQQRETVRLALESLLEQCGVKPAAAEPAAPQPAAGGDAGADMPAESLQPSAPAKPVPSAADEEYDRDRSTVENAREQVQPALFDRIEIGKAVELERSELENQVAEIIAEILAEEKIQFNQRERGMLVALLLDDMLGLGPLEPLLADTQITDIMVNGIDQVYVERGGKLELTDVRFRDHGHLMNVCTRIVSQVGRRVDEASPLCDARLADGSRVNIIIPPLAIDGASISIRKFAEKKITLDVMEAQANMSPAMATVLRIASRAQLNILISGGTGSGKTTLLNAMSQMIDGGERIVTIEDAAELQLQQPHVVRLETRPANLEGDGEITMRDLVKNALRMRPDRIILGEVRGSEAVDMLQAMNTGHEGSMCTVHANRPREALTRLENMVGMAGINLPGNAVRTQIASAIDIIVQVSRMRDGVRRITSVTEVVGMEGEVITTQELFKYVFEGEDSSGRLVGTFETSGVRPHFMAKAEYFQLGRSLSEAMQQ